MDFNTLKKVAFLTLTYLCLMVEGSVAQMSYPFGTIIKRVFDEQLKPVKQVDKPAEKAINSFQADGTWSDVDYNIHSVSNWTPYLHLQRTLDIIQGYVCPGARHYNDQKAYQTILQALETWCQKDPKSDNWWANEIKVPQQLGAAMILMRFSPKKLPDDLERRLLERMDRGDATRKTGANKADIATHNFYRALLTQDKELLAFSLQEFFETLKFNTGKEGLQHDLSYLQHGPQLYISGYGRVFLSSAIKMAKYVAETPYALSADQLNLLSEFSRNTYLKTFRSRYIDFNVEGRGISRPGTLRKSSEKYLFNDMLSVDAGNKAIWQNEISRIDSANSHAYYINPYHKHFWKGDYVIHVRPEYSFNVRMVSNRTSRSETGNEENLLGRYLSDGATNLQRRGPEYYDIMPLWEWDKIPGTTSPDHQTDIGMDVRWGERGHNDFAGGVSDGLYGVSAYQLSYDSVSAKKAWFFFDDEIVCLGADIHSNNPQPLTTTINQCWLNGPVSSSFTKKIKKDHTIHNEMMPDSWVQHDGVGYYFPEATKLNVSTQKQSGDWYHINHSHGKENHSGNVFKMWIDHGKDAKDETYSYVVLPAIKSFKSFNPQVLKILANTAQNQSVYHEKLSILQAVFYEASSIHSELLEVTADKACVLMMKAGANKWELYIADPLQNASDVTLNIKELKSGKTKTIKVSLPAGPLMGATTVTEIIF